MPNRVLREGLRSSGPVNALSDRGFRLYTNLLISADDFALLDWCFAWVKANAVPLQLWAEKDLAAAMRELEDLALVRPYDCAGRRYAAIDKWDQRRNANKPKFPMPPWGTEHIIGGYVPPKARTATNKTSSAEPPATVPLNGQAIEHLPLKGGGTFAVTSELIAELDKIYTLVDVPATVRDMKGWLIGNTNRLKTAIGIKRFITGWLAREQEKYAKEDDAKNRRT